MRYLTAPAIAPRVRVRWKMRKNSTERVGQLAGTASKRFDYPLRQEATSVSELCQWHDHEFPRRTDEPVMRSTAPGVGGSAGVNRHGYPARTEGNSPVGPCCQAGDGAGALLLSVQMIRSGPR